MTALTKDQVRKLAPEQQEALAGTVVQRFQSRQQLLLRARRGMSGWAALWTGLAGGFPMLCIPFPRALPIAIIAAVMLATFHASRLHRRLDALMELFDEDIRRATERKQSDEDRTS